jgi:hypothetical protein
VIRPGRSRFQECGKGTLHAVSRLPHLQLMRVDRRQGHRDTSRRSDVPRRHMQRGRLLEVSPRNVAAHLEPRHLACSYQQTRAVRGDREVQRALEVMLRRLAGSQ